MKIELLAEFDLQILAEQERSVLVSMGENQNRILFVYSMEEGIDLGEECYHYPKDTLNLALFDTEE